jgi:hypothetical protein
MANHLERVLEQKGGTSIGQRCHTQPLPPAAPNGAIGLFITQQSRTLTFPASYAKKRYNHEKNRPGSARP